MIKELLSETKRDYIFLKRLSPNHELLKYFTVDENELIYNPDEKILDEFVKKFRGSLPTPERVKEKRTKISFAEYQYFLILNLFRNYISSLENAIQFAELMN
jgi:hypothetical protein